MSAVSGRELSRANWQGPITEYPRQSCVHEVFDLRASEHPHAPAVRYGQRVLSYGRLRSWSDQLAHRLLASGVRDGERVGVCGVRSPEALVAALGVLKAGATYVPLDDTHPPARLRAMAEDTEIGMAVVLPGSTCRIRRLRTRIDLTDPELRSPESGEDEPTRQAAFPSGTVRSSDCAYVMFTSGSTGRPKPVAVPHRGVVRLAVSDLELAPPTPSDRVLHALSLSSDGSTHEIWSGLLNGACLVLVDREVLLSPLELEKFLREQEVTFAHLTTSVFHHMARVRPEGLSCLRFVSAGGEALDPDLVRIVLAACPSTTVVNFYGPTENSVVSTAHVVRELPPGADSVPIGRPLANSTAHVVRADGRPAAIGEEGELWVGGDGLALGYLADPGLTEQRFVADPIRQDRRVYRTGDRAVWRSESTLEYLGRWDRQIKLRGQRIELDEVEARLRAHPAVGEAVVETTSADATTRGLIAYVTPARAEREVPLAEVRSGLAAWLPAQAVPSRIVIVPRFPLTASGKVDRHQLTSGSEALPPRSSGAPPAVPGLLDTVAEVWSTTLGTRPTSEDGFFDLGGDSMLAAEAITRTLAVLGLDPRHGSELVHGLLRHPTLAEHAEAVGAVRDDDGRRERVEIDYVRESALGYTLPTPTGPVPNWRDPRRVLLTGATGFVGAYLLARLLESTEATVHCPVRARDHAHARHRVTANLARYGLDISGTMSRVVCSPADLAAPRMGMDEAEYAKLAGTTDLIVHSAAAVNFLYPYQSLRSSNVEGTREIVLLAAKRRIPVHFLSTIGVVTGFGTAGVRVVDEDTPLAHADRISMGYAESKWVAERMLSEAARGGLPVAIYRPYEITGDQYSGICNTDTAICSLFRVFAETGTVPDVAMPMDFVPVDYLTHALLRIATEHVAEGQVYHLTNPRPAMLADVLDRMRVAGFELRTRSYPQWVTELVRHVTEHPTSPAAPFVSLCIDRANKSDITVKEMYFADTFPKLGRTNVDSALSGTTTPTCPPVDSDLIDLYLNYLITSGYLPRPGNPGR